MATAQLRGSHPSVRFLKSEGPLPIYLAETVGPERRNRRPHLHKEC